MTELVQDLRYPKQWRVSLSWNAMCNSVCVYLCMQIYLYKYTYHKAIEYIELGTETFSKIQIKLTDLNGGLI